MVPRDVQSVEIVILGFDLGAVQDGEPERDEELLELALDAGDRVQMAAARSGGWQREIEPFGVEAGAEGGVVEPGLAGVEGGFEALLGAVEQHARALAVLGREFAHLLAELGKSALAPERVDADGLQFLGGRGGGDARQGTGLQFLYRVF
jgi:hypothetical protein